MNFLKNFFAWLSGASDTFKPAATRKRLLGTIQGAEIVEFTDGRVEFTADADIDCDGSGGNPLRDPYFQPDTTLHHNGRALNAEKERFIVVPPLVIRETKGVVMGCKARVTHTRTGKSITAVVGDLGPTKKVGELSTAAARALGIPSNPNTGGEGSFIIKYELWPGVPAEVDGVTYKLQSRA